jgi:hypothetical protein
MTLTPSHIAATSLTQMFAALQGILEKAGAHAKTHNIDEAVLMNWRLFPDMFTMARQVQIATDIAGRGMARLAGAALPSNPDTETSFEALRARVLKTQAFIKDLDRAAIDADPTGEVSFPVGPETMTMKRQDYLLTFILPNVYFHVTTAYAILRACGAPLGKADFLARGR